LKEYLSFSSLCEYTVKQWLLHFGGIVNMNMKTHHCMEASEKVLVMQRGKEVRSTQNNSIQQFKNSPNTYFASVFSAKKPEQIK
jgi:hypothetical protein